MSFFAHKVLVPVYQFLSVLSLLLLFHLEGEFYLEGKFWDSVDNSYYNVDKDLF